MILTAPQRVFLSHVEGGSVPRSADKCEERVRQHLRRVGLIVRQRGGDFRLRWHLTEMGRAVMAAERARTG